MTINEARGLYTAGNNAGYGFATYTDTAGDDTVEAAVEAFVADGWELVDQDDSDSGFALLRDGDGAWVAVGGDGMGRNAWAVVVSEVR